MWNNGFKGKTFKGNYIPKLEQYKINKYNCVLMTLNTPCHDKILIVLMAFARTRNDFYSLELILPSLYYQKIELAIAQFFISQI